jgi:chemotaxis signal transduction protein
MQERVPALVFTVRGHLYGLLQDGGASLLPWLQRYVAPGAIPGVPAWMLGLLNVQGTVQAIVDLGAFLGLGASAPNDHARLVFVERDELRVGLLVDSTTGIRYFDAVDYGSYDVAEPLVAGVATCNGQRVRVLDGAALIDALARALEPPLTKAPQGPAGRA